MRTRISRDLAVIVGVVGFLSTSVAPAAEFESKAVVNFDRTALVVDHKNASTDQLTRKEAARLRARNTMDLVVQRLGLAKKWGLDPTAATKRLQRQVVVAHIRGSSRITIAARAADPKEAHALTEGLVDAYRKHRNEEETARAKAALELFDRRIAIQKKDVERLRETMAEVRKSLGNPPNDLPPIVAVRQESERSKKVLADLERDQRARTIELKLPRIPITIHEKPTVPTTPIKD